MASHKHGNDIQYGGTFVLRLALVTRISMAMPLLCWGMNLFGQEPPQPLTLPPGENITLNVENVEVTALLRLLSEARKVNIIAGPEVSGAVSINLYDVPFDKALDAILGIAGFAHYSVGDIIHVTSESAKRELPLSAHDMEFRVYEIHHLAPSDVMSVITPFLSPSGTVVTSAQAGGADGAGAGSGGQLVVQDAPEYLAQVDELIKTLDAPPHEAMVFPIGHAEPDSVLTAITAFLSPNGQASVGAGDDLLVRDAPEYLDTIAALIAQLDLPPKQVLISARILSVSYSDDLSLGLEFDSSTLAYASKLATPLPVVGDLGQDVTTVSTGEVGVTSTIVRDHELGVLDALSKRSNVETLAAPQLLAIDGEEAEIRIGGNLGYPVTVTTENGVTTRSTEFLEVGTTLIVTPSVVEEGLIRLQVHPEVSTGSITGDLPQKETTEATTAMLVRHGETVMIGGLLNVSRQRTRKQVPILGDIPLLGLLFGRNTWLDTKKELIILVTPYIVGPETTVSMQEQDDWVEDFSQKLAPRRSDARRLFGGDFKRDRQNAPLEPKVGVRGME